MFITVTTDGEEIYNLEIDSQMAIEDVKALLEAEVTWKQPQVENKMLTLSIYFLFLSQVFHPKHNVYFIMAANYRN